VAGEEPARVRVDFTDAPAGETAARAAGPATIDVTATNASVLRRILPVAFCNIIGPPGSCDRAFNQGFGPRRRRAR
jgi:hypothetical protein